MHSRAAVSPARPTTTRSIMISATPRRRGSMLRKFTIFIADLSFISVVNHDGCFEGGGRDPLSRVRLLNGDADGQEVADPLDVEAGLIDDAVAVVVDSVG